MSEASKVGKAAKYYNPVKLFLTILHVSVSIHSSSLISRCSSAEY